MKNLTILALTILSIFTLTAQATTTTTSTSTSSATNPNQTPAPNIAPTPFQISLPVVWSNGNNYSTPSYVQNLNCSMGWVNVPLANNKNYITVPYTANYSLDYMTQTFNNNGGSVEWNTVQYQFVKYAADGSSAVISGCSWSQGQQGGGCGSCGKYNAYYNWNMNCATNLNAGDNVGVQVNFSGSGTGCGGSSVLTIWGAFTVLKTN